MNEPKKLIVFITCQRSGSSVTVDYFHRRGVHLGDFEFFLATPDDPFRFFEPLPFYNLEQKLHRAVYGFTEDSIRHDIAAEIIRNREPFLPGIGQFDPSWIDEGVSLIKQLVGSAPVSGFKRPASTLFWFYWKHVLRQIPDLRTHLVFLLRPPKGIAASYSRRDGHPENAFYDLIRIYLEKQREIYSEWSGDRSFVRYTHEHYHNDLEAAVSACGLRWDEEEFLKCFDPSRTHRMEAPVNHPVQQAYERLLERYREN